MTHDEAVARAKREIRQDVGAGTVPASVTSFAELHDFVDANEYGGATETFEGTAGDVAFWNRVQAELDDWIRGGMR